MKSRTSVASAGFGSWPKTKWPWGGELALRPGVHALKVHRGKVLLCHQAAMRAVDPLARAALAEADAAGDEGSRLVRHLRSAGPSKIDDVKAELGLEAPALRKVREKLESLGVVVSRDVAVDDGKGGHRTRASSRDGTRCGTSRGRRIRSRPSPSSC